jgi:hypothetical protein
MANSINPKHAVYGVKAYLSISGKKIPIVRCSMEFVLNQIPIATVQVPSGFKIDGSVARPDTSTILTEDDLLGRKKAQILLSGEGSPHPSSPERSKATPSGSINEKVIFDGYLISKSIQFSASANSTTLVISHWLIDLDSSTFVSGSFAKNSPSQWFVQEETYDKGNPTLKPVRIDGAEVTSQDVLNKDWWSDIVYPALKYKAGLRLVNFRDRPVPTETGPLLEALGKIKSYDMLKLTAEAKADLIFEVGVSIKDKMYDFLYPAGGSSGFEKLVNMFSYFGVALAPRVDECVLIPYNPVAKVDKVIKDYECDLGGSNANVSILPRGAIIYGHAVFASKGIADDGNTYDSDFLGTYVAADGEEYLKGPWVTAPVPEWLLFIQGATSNKPFDTMQGIIPDGEAPQPGADKPQPIKPFRSMGNAIAKAYYFNTLFATKYQDVLCGLRFDIAPGDSVQVEGGGSTGQNISGLGSNWKKRGIVESVSIVLDSVGSGQINTTIRLKHVFEASDIKVFNAAMDSNHPFFGSKPANGLPPLKQV